MEGARRDPGGRRVGAATWGIVLGLVLAGMSAFVLAVALADVHATGSGQFARAAYCSVSGNTAVDGSPLQPGTFLDLVVGSPNTNGHYAGATPANFVDGIGLTCDNPPAGYVRVGLATAAQHVATGIYPYYAPPKSSRG